MDPIEDNQKDAEKIKKKRKVRKVKKEREGLKEEGNLIRVKAMGTKETSQREREKILKKYEYSH